MLQEEQEERLASAEGFREVVCTGTAAGQLCGLLLPSCKGQLILLHPQPARQGSQPSCV